MLEQAGHRERKGVGNLGAFAETAANEIAEVGGFIVETAGGEGLVELDDAAVEVVDGGARGVPPVGVDENVAERGGEQGVPVREQIEAGVELGKAALVLGVDDGEGIDAGGREAAEGVDLLQGAEPVEGQKGLVRPDAQDAAAAEFREVKRVVGSEG